MKKDYKLVEEYKGYFIKLETKPERKKYRLYGKADNYFCSKNTIEEARQEIDLVDGTKPSEFRIG